MFVWQSWESICLLLLKDNFTAYEFKVGSLVLLFIPPNTLNVSIYSVLIWVISEKYNSYLCSSVGKASYLSNFSKDFTLIFHSLERIYVSVGVLFVWLVFLLLLLHFCFVFAFILLHVLCCGFVSNIHLGRILSHYFSKCFFCSFPLSYPCGIPATHISCCEVLEHLLFFLSLCYFCFSVLEISIVMSSSSDIVLQLCPGD